MAIQHKDIQHAECHEPRHITAAGTGDAGKVITPSASDAGKSVLRALTAAEVGALALVGGTTTGKVNINHADGLEVQGDKVVGGRQPAISDATVGTVGNSANPGSADVGDVQAELDGLEGKINLILAALRTHGLIAT